jgi:hypothetical protein
MSRQPSLASQTTMYRLRRQSDAHLSSYLQQKYFEPDRGFVSREVRVGGVDGLLVYGMMRTERPDWLGHAEELTGITPEVSNTTSAGVLLLPYDEFVYALSWGMGFLTLSSRYLDNGFGIRFAIRKANPKRACPGRGQAGWLSAHPRTATRVRTPGHPRAGGPRRRRCPARPRRRTARRRCPVARSRRALSARPRPAAGP